MANEGETRVERMERELRRWHDTCAARQAVQETRTDKHRPHSVRLGTAGPLILLLVLLLLERVLVADYLSTGQALSLGLIAIDVVAAAVVFRPAIREPDAASVGPLFLLAVLFLAERVLLARYVYATESLGVVLPAFDVLVAAFVYRPSLREPERALASR